MNFKIPDSSSETKLYFSPFIPFAENEEMHIKEEHIITVNEPKSEIRDNYLNYMGTKIVPVEKNYIMTDKKVPDNIIIGPWDAHGKVNDEQPSDWVKRKYQKALDKNNTQLKKQEKISKIDIITEGVMVQLIHTLSENGYDIGEDSFILDIGFLSETVKSIPCIDKKNYHMSFKD